MRSARHRRRPATRRLQRPQQVAVVALLGLGLAVLFNAGSMQRSAQTSPFGVRRTLSLAVLGPLSRLSGTLRLDRPRAALDALVDHGRPSGSGDATQPDVRIDAPAPVAHLDGAQIVHRTLVRGPSRHPWTPEQPLRLWVGGDSVSGFLTIEMVNLAQQTGVVSAHGHYKISTGLSRPDNFDWPATLREDAAAYDPEVVVFCVGANDDQAIATGDTVYEFGSAGWRDQYAHRVAAVMDMLTSQGRMVVWVGQPVMRSPDFMTHMSLMNDIYAAEAARRTDVVFFDSRHLFSDAQGNYAPYLPDSSGNLTLMRAEDGIHLTPQGGMRLAQAVLDTLRTRWQADDSVSTVGLVRGS